MTYVIETVVGMCSNKSVVRSVCYDCEKLFYDKSVVRNVWYDKSVMRNVCYDESVVRGLC